MKIFQPTSMDIYALEISPRLQRIDFLAKRISYFTSCIRKDIVTLPMRPSFETKAESSLKEARADLVETLAAIDSALALYERKPDESQAA